MAVLSDPISDFLTRVKNAGAARNEGFSAPYSSIKAEIARILQAEGYIWSYEIVGEGKDKAIKVKSKFTNEGKSIITDVKRVSKPGRRVYVPSSEIPTVMNGLGISIVSTSRGMMTGAQARKQQIGGELIALVW
ncbi:MAG: 30S ribosomal protein S8 [Clostridia bacterium]|nr:30S ribosomal protein S8 [Akkermansia sp.]MBR2320331.1 30S ribosomal protein S8 [Clostridia bacterium]